MVSPRNRFGTFFEMIFPPWGKHDFILNLLNLRQGRVPALDLDGDNPSVR